MAEGEKTLTINEIYHSIQGESTWVGRPCVFVRLTFCDLRCNYCDTEYAFYEGKKQTLKEIVDAVEVFRCPLVEITGGEPLLQKNVLPLMSRLCDARYTVLLETSGAHDISKVDSRVHRIMDLKTPGSGEVEKNLWSSDAQIHLEPDPAGSLIDAIPPEAVILSAGEGSHINWWSTLIDLCAARFAGGLPHPESVQGSG